MRGRGLKTLSAKRRIADKANSAARANNAAMLARKERSDGTAIVRLGAIASLPRNRHFCNYLFPPPKKAPEWVPFWWWRGTYPRKARERRGAIKTNRVMAKVFVLRRSHELPENGISPITSSRNQKAIPKQVSLFGGGKR